MTGLHTAEYAKLRRALIEARHNAGMTQQEVADLLGKPQSFVAKYEKGERRLDVIEFLSLSRVIGFSSHKILDAVLQG